MVTLNGENIKYQELLFCFLLAASVSRFFLFRVTIHTTNAHIKSTTTNKRPIHSHERLSNHKFDFNSVCVSLFYVSRYICR